MRLFSDTVEYGLRAAVFLAARPPRPFKVREIADGTQAPPGYLLKVLQSLARAGILSAQRGRHGGFSLRRDPDSLTVLEVLDAIDRLDRLAGCPLGRPEHAHGLCPLHRELDEAIARIREAFGSTPVARLVAEPDHLTLCAVAGAGSRS